MENKNPPFHLLQADVASILYATSVSWRGLYLIFQVTLHLLAKQAAGGYSPCSGGKQAKLRLIC
jgi:hypothetical protein